MHEDRKQRLSEFVAWVGGHIRGDEKGEAQIFLDRLFQAFGYTVARELKGKSRMSPLCVRARICSRVLSAIQLAKEIGFPFAAQLD